MANWNFIKRICELERRMDIAEKTVMKANELSSKEKKEWEDFWSYNGSLEKERNI